MKFAHAVIIGLALSWYSPGRIAECPGRAGYSLCSAIFPFSGLTRAVRVWLTPGLPVH